MQEKLEAQTKRTVPADPTSQPLQPTAHVQGNARDDDPEEIFLNAVAEIDTQPLVKGKRKRAGTLTIADVVEIAFLVTVLCGGLVGSMYLAITYPHTLVILYAKAQGASITATLPVPTRPLAPVTLTRSGTAPTTGTGHQDARAATGILTFYNGQVQRITVPGGSVFTGRDGEQVVTTQDAVIPAADPSTTPPTYGEATVSAQAVHTGASGDIAAFDLNGSCCAPSVIVKNLAAFTNGQDARTYHAVAAQDLQTVTATVNNTVTQAFTSAFSLQPDEAAVPTHCHTTTTANHQIGEEAQSVTLTLAKTCSAVAYNSQQLNYQARAAFEQTKPGANYHVVGSIQTSLKSVTPLTVALSGQWAYTFSPGYEQLLAQGTQGESPAKAKAYLLKTGVISYVSIPNRLPPADYITFLVLLG
jgi:hypothetical protein